jgi:hypothetical protein
LEINGRPMAFILEGHTPVPCGDLMAVGRLLHDVDSRTVARTDIGNATVSTVFLCFDHGIEGIPILFETMVLTEDGFQEDILRRYYGWDEALAGHNDIVLQIADQIVDKRPEPAEVSIPTIEGVRVIRV